MSKKKIEAELNIAPNNKESFVALLFKFLVGFIVILGSAVLVLPFSIVKFVILIFSKVLNALKKIRFPKIDFKKPQIKTKISLPFPKLNIEKIRMQVIKFFAEIVAVTKEKLNNYFKGIAVSSKEIKLKKRSKKEVKAEVSDVKKQKVGATKPGKLSYYLSQLINNKYFAFLFGCLFAVIFILLPFYVYSWFSELPSPELINERITKCTKILDRKSRLLYEVCPDKKADPVKLSDVPKNMVNATLSIEDAYFYEHGGFNPVSILRAAKETFLKDNVQGGSTITQQLVKLTLLSPERTFTRKIKELVLSIAVENKFSKDEILEMYLNSAPYGGSVVGVESAAQKFFGKSAKDLTLSEASLLAGLPTAPSIYSPYTAFNLAKQRQKLVLDRMVAHHYVKKEEAQKAYDEELNLSPQIDYIRAPHFVDYVREVLENTYGKRYANFGGLTVRTTLDLDIQEQAQQIIKEEIEKSKYLSVSNGAAVVLDAKTGQILAMVGSTDYFNKENQGVYNASTAHRLPGSTIKVVTYSLALSKGYRTTSIIEDTPISYKSGSSVYTPANYDGKFHGKVTLRAALANSYNIPAVKLLNSLNIDDMVRLANKMGLREWEADGNYGLAITLGGKETRLLDLTNVFGTLARGGVYTNTKPFLEVRDANGYSILKNDNVSERALSEDVAYVMTNILSDYYARLPAFGVNNFLSIKGHTVAVKTGTTDYKKDNYTVGYTPSYAVGVWVGNNNNSPMNPNLASGLTGAAPAWNRIMSYLLKDSVNEEFPVPSGVVVKSFKDCNNITEVYVKSNAPDNLKCTSDKDSDKKDKKKN